MAPLNKKQLYKAQNARVPKAMTNSLREDVMKSFTAVPAKYSKVAIYNGDDVQVHDVTDAKISYQGSFGAFTSKSSTETTADAFKTPIEKMAKTFEDSINKAKAAENQREDE